MYDYDRTASANLDREAELTKNQSRRAAAGGPDPLTMKAFTSEYETGKRRGLDGGKGNLPANAQASLAEDEMVTAAIAIRDLANRIIKQGQSGSVRINPMRAGSKFSTHLSTLFYQAGLAEGLSKR